MTTSNIIEEFKKLYPGQDLIKFPLQADDTNYGDFIFARENVQICLELLLTDTYFYDHMVQAWLPWIVTGKLY